ncbi:MAG: DMT family transporter [Alphaproteobacteria bacterium]|nr:DMT family transporter [Alphaproteobacteria bacterium]MDP7164220.1 DMT family transporter [Alphaproteobacteria bacterium]
MTIPARLAYLAVFIGVLGHASSEFFAVLSGISGPEVSVWRYLFGGAGLIAVALVLEGPRRLLEPLSSHAWPLIGTSLIGVSGAYLAFHWALDFASVIQVATLVTTIPIFVGLANLVANRLPISGLKMATGACAVGGLALLITDGAMERLLGGSDSLIGIGLGILCAALVAGYAVAIKPIIALYGAMRTTALSLAIGGLGLWLGVGLAFAVWVDPTTLFQRPAVAWGSILALALWNTTITQFLWIGGLAAAADMTRASYLFFLKPVIAAGLALGLLGDELSLLQAAAMLVVMASVLVEVFWPRFGRRPEGGASGN